MGSHRPEAQEVVSMVVRVGSTFILASVLAIAFMSGFAIGSNVYLSYGVEGKTNLPFLLTEKPGSGGSLPLPWKKAAAPDAEGLDLSVNLPFEMLRRRYVQALTRGGMTQDRDAVANLEARG